MFYSCLHGAESYISTRMIEMICFFRVDLCCFTNLFKVTYGAFINKFNGHLKFNKLSNVSIF